MRVIPMLTGGIKKEVVAQKFVKEFYAESETEGGLSLPFAVEFVTETFRSIGFNCNFTTSQILHPNECEWPLEWRVYSFAPNRLQVEQYAQYLVAIGAEVRRQHELYLNKRPHITAEELKEGVNPLNCYIGLMMIWYNMCRKLERLEMDADQKRFEEPIAYINVHLLFGMQCLRRLYTSNALLAKICDRFFRTAINGLFYQRTHEIVSTGLIVMLEKDFMLYHLYAPHTTGFYFEAFSAVKHNTTYLKVIDSLTRMLNGPGGHIIKHFAVQEHMLEVYYTIMSRYPSSILHKKLLKFLNQLQRKFPSTDCFSQDFIECILSLVISSDNASVKKMAAETFLTIMQRRVEDNIILKSILDFYMTTNKTIDALSEYIDTLWECFPYMRVVENYFDILSMKLGQWALPFTAQFFVIVYNKLLPSFVSNAKKIELVLMTLPNLLEKIQCNCTIGILMQVYPITDFTLLKENSEKFTEIVNRLETYAADKFLHTTDTDSSLIPNLFVQMNRCYLITQNEDILEEKTVRAYWEFQRVNAEFVKALKSGEMPPEQDARDFELVMRKMQQVSLINWDPFDWAEELYKKVKMFLLDEPLLQRAALKYKTYLDLRGIELITYSFIKFAKQAVSSVYHSNFVKQEVLLLEMFLWKHLNLIKAQENVIPVSVMFNVLVDFYRTMSDTSRVGNFCIKPKTYNELVNLLIYMNFENKAMQFSRLQREHQKQMLDKFTELHKAPGIQISFKCCWKLCLFFGMPSYLFQNELEGLLKVLIQHHFHNYREIIPVVIYNIFKKKMNSRTITSVLKRHIQFIRTEVMDIRRKFLQVHIVMSLLDALKKSLLVLKVCGSSNRLIALDYLHIMIEDISINDAELQKEIENGLREIRQHLLTSAELNSLRNFLNHIKFHDANRIRILNVEYLQQ